MNISEKYQLTSSYLVNKKNLSIDEELKEKYNELIKDNYSNDQENKVNQSIFISETNTKIYNGIKKIIGEIKINIDFDSIDINID